MILFTVIVICLGASVQAVKPPQESPSLESRLQDIQSQYEAALYEAYLPYAPYFEKAYQAYPVIPKGVLEAIAYAETDFHYKTPNEDAEYASYGLMGLVQDGKEVFKENLLLVSDLSGYTLDEIKSDPEIHIMAFATAYVALKNQFQVTSNRIEDHITILKELSNLPTSKETSRFPMDVYLYTVLSFLNDSQWQSMFNFPAYSTDLRAIFGEDNYRVLSTNYLSVPGPSNQNSYGATTSQQNP